MVQNQKIIDVVAAIIEKDGKFLIAKRKKGKHLEGKWEFPGGKIEADETPEKCLERELKEEFGILVRAKGFVVESQFNYGDREVRLLGYKANYVAGDFVLNDHEEIKWVLNSEFGRFDFAEADLPLVKKLLNNS